MARWGERRKEPRGEEDRRDGGGGTGEKTQTLAPHTASAAFVNFSTRDPGASADIPRASEVQVIPPDQTTALTVGPMDVDAVPHT
jgi:hypothetical protein